MTLAQLRLGRISRRDALFYMIAQLFGGAAGVGLAYAVLGETLAAPATRFCVTVPGDAGEGVAFVAEIGMSFAMAMVSLSLSSSRHARFTSVAAGLLVALYITFEAPLSGMSINPARTLASAVFAHDYGGLWLYMTAPPLGMLLAAEVHERALSRRRVTRRRSASPCNRS